jgi:hypothetical protein
LLALGSAATVLYAGGSPVWLALGGLSWAAALALKIPLSGIASTGLARFPASLQGITLGAISAATELGIAWLALESTHIMPASIFDFMALAVGAGSTEALGVLVWTVFQPADAAAPAAWRAQAERAWHVRHQFAIERTLAWLGQFGSRMLLCATQFFGWWWPLTVAMLTFSATDGLAAYGHARGWDWSAPRALGGYFVAATLLVAIELGALVYLWRSLP